MTVKLMVNWHNEEILTVKEFDERIDARVDKMMQDADVYDEYLDDYLDTNYTRIELFNALSDSDTEREEVLNNIRSGVAEAIYDWVSMDMYSDYSEVIVEV